MSAPAVSVMIVDDHQVVIDGLRAVLGDAPDLEVAGYANRGDEALRLLPALRPDVLLLDIDMPGMNGLVLLERLRREGPEPRVVMLSMHLEPAVIRRAIELGADGYLPKNADGAEVLRALREVAAGRPWFAGSVTVALSGAAGTGPSAEGGPAGEAAALASLTEREREVLVGIAEGLSSKEIAERLYLSPRTVDTHRTNIMRKLDVHKVAGLIRFALRHGLVD
jgi:DNA-binding NarL/FixJ family response regulator